MTKKTLGEMIEEWSKELYEERAGIREHCGNQTREHAEEAARIEVEGWKKKHQGTEIQK